MIDLHSHILYGVDDGSQSLEESIEMIQLAYAHGTQVIVATPHANQKGRYENYYSPSLLERFHTLEQEVQRENIPVQLCLGMEIYASEDVVDKIESNALISLNGSKHILIEFGFHEHAHEMERILLKVIQDGRVPLIAHPERYRALQRDPSWIEEWLDLDCLIQVNAGSLFGYFGSGAKECSRYLLEQGLVNCIASDGHDSFMRTPTLDKAYDWVEWHYGFHAAQQLFVKNPKHILAK